MIPENSIGIMDRGFASWEFLDEMSLAKTMFVVRIKNNMKTEFDHDRIPAFYGSKLLDKFRYLQLELTRRCSIVHWSYDLLPETLMGLLQPLDGSATDIGHALYRCCHPVKPLFICHLSSSDVPAL